MPKLLTALPVDVVRRLCQHLNVEGAGVRNWQDLMTKVKDNPYDILDPGTMARNGLRPYCSPAQQVIDDFVARGIDVDALYHMLADMDAGGCMAILEAHVSPAVVTTVKRKRAQLQFRSHDLHGTSSADSTPSPDCHPGIGYFPPRPPPSPPPPIISSVPPPPTSSVASTSYPAPPTTSAPPTSSSPPPTSSSALPTRYPPPPTDSPAPPTTSATVSHAPMYDPSHSSHGNGGPALPRQQYLPGQWAGQWAWQAGQWEGPLHPSQSSVGDSSSGYIASDHTHHPGGQPHLPPGHVTSSCSSDSSVFTYGSESSQTTHPSSQTTPPSASGSESSVGGGCLNILHFSYAELSEATGRFTEGMVGIGAFGTVFRAMVRGNGPYAIKKLHTETEMGVHGGQFYETFHQETFAHELQLLTKYHHRNILSLVAYSNDGYRPCLVYEYMENGSLAECLQGKTGVCLRWDIRLNIATQVATALNFLHTVNHPTCLVHGDIKSANILLDVNHVPKLSDFGLARELTSKANCKSTVSTRSHVVMGTMAYMAPEFLRNKKLTTRTDVYAFGVVMLELYTGQPAFSSDPALKERMLTERLCELLEDSECHAQEVLMAADQLAGWPQETAVGLFDIISVSLQSKQRRRPPIRQVLDQLLILPQ